MIDILLTQPVPNLIDARLRSSYSIHRLYDAADQTAFLDQVGDCIRPRVPDALGSLSNVVLQPHRASAAEQTRLALGDIELASLQACFEGADLLTAVAC